MHDKTFDLSKKPGIPVIYIVPRVRSDMCTKIHDVLKERVHPIGIIMAGNKWRFWPKFAKLFPVNNSPGVLGRNDSPLI